jgi:hypothetical protein
MGTEIPKKKNVGGFLHTNSFRFANECENNS